MCLHVIYIKTRLDKLFIRVYIPYIERPLFQIFFVYPIRKIPRKSEDTGTKLYVSLYRMLPTALKIRNSLT
jgi:hypothetical protein